MAVYKKGFLGNERLRPAGVAIEWDQHKINEFKKCSEDPVYFMSNYIRILNLDSEELVLFKPRQYQVNMVQTIKDNRFTIAKWGRQSGKTTSAAAMLLWYVIFNSNFPTLILAHKHDKAREIIAVVQKMYEFLPEWLQHGVIAWAKGSFELENGSSVKTSGTSTSSGRGGSYALLLLDEFAFVPSFLADEFLKSVIPTISSGKNTKLVITSTPKGLNTFYRLWMDSVNGKNDYARVDVNWFDIPGRDEAFKEKIISTYGREYWMQEYESAWLGSSATLLSADCLTSIVTRQPLYVSSTGQVWEEPVMGHTYAMTVDVSEGLGEDYSAAVVFDITSLPYRPVALFRDNRTEPMQLPAIVHEMATAYNEALVLVEANFGQQVGEILHQELEYENLVFTQKGKTGPKAKTDQISSGHTPRARVGLAWNAHSKRVGCTNLKTLVENGQLEVVSELVYDELTRFAVKGKSYAAEDGHDDLAMCFVLFAWMVDQGYVRETNGVDIRGRIAQLNADRIEREMMPLGWRLDGDEGEGETIEMERDRFPIEVPDPETGEHRWDGLFDKGRARGGHTEEQLHDMFMREFFNVQ